MTIEKTRATQIKKFKIPDEFDLIKKQKSYVPGPIYAMDTDWSKILKNKGKFTKTPRKTYTENIILTEKRIGVPGPGTYSTQTPFGVVVNKDKQKVLDANKVDKLCAFIEEA